MSACCKRAVDVELSAELADIALTGPAFQTALVGPPYDLCSMPTRPANALEWDDEYLTWDNETLTWT